MATRTPVPAPPAAAPRVGLIPSALDATRHAQRWETGYQYRSEMCGAGGIEQICDPEPLDDDLLEINDVSGLVSYEPFVVWAGDRCTVAQWQSEEWKSRVQRKLVAIQGYYVEREFWRGDYARAASPDRPNAFLASPDSDVVTSSPARVADAVGCIERALSEGLKGQRGMIHASSDVIAQMHAANLIIKEGQVLVTASDSIVVPGAGYDGSGPDGQAAADGSSWIYGTSLVSVRLSEIDYTGGPDATGIFTDENTLEVRAFRAAAAGFDPCYYAAAEVDVPACNVDLEGS